PAAKEGVVVLYVQHTTAGLTVNEHADPDAPRDLLHALRTLIPQHGMGFRHGEENSDAHIKASLVGPSVTIPFHDGKLLLGRWQGIFLCEFDGGRERKVIMMIGFLECVSEARPRRRAHTREHSLMNRLSANVLSIDKSRHPASPFAYARASGT